ncbi:CoA transferase subunit A [Histidinibacterium lentulum]|uniref:CoA transferase subunit A n=2 Tax=Histidinibacterium lentulum TaxID=2480588 RepID=A0A3N2QRK1_9RHOB|nr:CoA transferase subunit A [Histidinibacterium lentulum]
MVRDHVRPGQTLFLGGFGHAVPFALGQEIVRQGIGGLTLCRSGADILFDQMIAAGVVRRVIFGYVGNPGVGLGHAFRRAVAAGTLELEEWTNFAMILRLHAGRLGVPFLPARILGIGDQTPATAAAARIACPYTGTELTAIPALVPDVALIHAQQADDEGNVQLWGVDGDTVEGALASERILVTVERIVPAATLRAAPERTRLPAHRVTAVAEVPWGAHPSWVDGAYGRDDAHYRDYDAVSRDPATLDRWLDDWVRSGGGARCTDLLTDDDLAALRTALGGAS